MENKLNVPKLEYKTGEPMWVHWDNRYVLRGGHILGKCPDENLITTVRSDVFPLTETESPVSMDKDGLCYLHN